MSYIHYPRVAFGFLRFKARRAHPMTLALIGMIAATGIVATIHFARPGEARASTGVTPAARLGVLFPSAQHQQNN